MKSRDGAKKQLPVVLPAVPNELLSSWISRHAAFYGVSPRAMLRHADPNARSLRAADDHLTDEQGGLLAHIFRREIVRYSLHDVHEYPSSARRLVAGEPIQTCSTCATKEHRRRRECNNLAQLASGLAHHVSCLRISIERGRAGGRSQQRRRPAFTNLLGRSARWRASAR